MSEEGVVPYHTIMRCDCGLLGGCDAHRLTGARYYCEREGDAMVDVGWRVLLKTTDHVSLWPLTPLSEALPSLLSDPEVCDTVDEYYERDEDGVFSALCPECALTVALEW